MPTSLPLSLPPSPDPSLTRRYLDTTAPSQRPVGVVFVDVDRDEVHLGVDEERLGEDAGEGEGCTAGGGYRWD